MKKNRCNLIILFTFIILSIPILAFADNRQAVGQIPVNYLQWQSNNVYPLMSPTLLIVQQKVINSRVQHELDQLSQSADYRGVMVLSRRNRYTEASYIVITGKGYRIVNVYPEINSIPLVVEQKTDNRDLQRHIDNLPFPDSYRGFIHLPQLDSIAGDNYIVMDENNYYLITLLAKESLPAPVVEQKTDNPYLQQYIDNLPTPSSYQGFMHLPKQDRVFDSYIVLEGSNHHLVNILEDGTLFSQPNIAKHWSQDEQEKDNHWTIYTIDESLNLKVTEAIIHYSQLQKKFLITRKINEQRYRVNDIGEPFMVSNKQFPNVVTKYDPTNLDNCLDLSISFEADAREDHILPLPVSNYYTFNRDIIDDLDVPDLGIGHYILDSHYCNDGIVKMFILLPKRHSNGVSLYLSEFNDYLVTFNEHRQQLDMMVIRYRGDDNQRNIDYTINHDYSIDLTMTEPDGNVVKETFYINPQGEFE